MPVLHVPAVEERGPRGLQNLLKEEEKEKDEEDKKEDDNYEEEMGRKTRDVEDMQHSLAVAEGVMVKFLFVTCHLALSLQLLLQGSFHQEQVKQPHFRNTQDQPS